MKLRKELKWLLQRVKNKWHFFRSIFWVVYYGYPARKLIVIGVTGTDGKTTTSTLIYEMLKSSGLKAGLVTTIGAKFIPSSRKEVAADTGLHATNPEAKELQPLLKKMKGEGVTHVVLEATAHGLDQHRLLGINFQIAVLTNLSHEHLDDFITMERYARAKLKLFRGARFIVLNKDDEWYEFFKSRIRASQKVIIYSKSDFPNENIPRSIKGEYNKYNIAAASAAAHILEIPDEVIKKVVRNFGGVSGRREEVENVKGIKVVIDFAHTPNALRSILSELRTETKNKLIVTFGCTGGRDQEKRPIMGKIASEMADVMIITSDDTREEKQDDIARQIVSGIGNYKEKIEESSLIVENDRRKAINIAINLSRPGDIVLLAGKGHEKTINLGGVEHPWSDATVAREALESKR